MASWTSLQLYLLSTFLFFRSGVSQCVMPAHFTLTRITILWIKMWPLVYPCSTLEIPILLSAPHMALQVCKPLPSPRLSLWPLPPYLHLTQACLRVLQGMAISVPVPTASAGLSGRELPAWWLCLGHRGHSTRPFFSVIFSLLLVPGDGYSRYEMVATPLHLLISHLRV